MKIPEITRYAPAPEGDSCRHCQRPYDEHDGGHGLAVICRVPTPEQARQAFKEVMAEGTDRFTTAFLAETIEVVRLARTYGLDVDDAGTRTVLATLTYEICAAREGVTT